jgi:hypothetical protein
MTHKYDTINSIDDYLGYGNLQDLYDQKYPDDINPKSKIVKKPRKHIKPDIQLIKKFNNFLNHAWLDDWYYSPSDFDEIFGINRHLARYYLLNMVYENKLFRVKYLNKTFFIKRRAMYNSITAESKFREYIWMEVKITAVRDNYN